MPTGAAICASPLAMTEMHLLSRGKAQCDSRQLLIVSGRLRGIAPQREISIAFPPDLDEPALASILIVSDKPTLSFGRGANMGNFFILRISARRPYGVSRHKRQR
jgi:hypothetical protein